MSYSRSRLLARITAPAGEPLSLSETKLYLRVDHDDEDTLISDLIVAARMTAEDWLRRSLMSQAWKLVYDDYLPEIVQLPMGPVNDITSVTVLNRDATSQSVSSSTYYLNAAMNCLIFDSPVLGFMVELAYTTGYGDADVVPAPIKQGLLSHIAALYDNRGEDGAMTLPEQTLRLYMPFREVRL